MESKVIKVNSEEECLNLFNERVDEIVSNSLELYKEVKDTVSILRNELCINSDFTALCAPQVGKKLRLFMIKDAHKKYQVFLNPLIVSKSHKIHLSLEKNASLDGCFLIPRANEIHLAYQTVDGHVCSNSYIGAYAEVIQQMVEMLDGITLYDYGLNLDDIGGLEAFNSASEEERTKVIELYLDNLKKYNNQMKELIESDPQLKLLNDTIEFNTNYILGNIKPIDKDGNIVEPKKKEVE